MSKSQKLYKIGQQMRYKIIYLYIYKNKSVWWIRLNNNNRNTRQRIQIEYSLLWMLTEANVKPSSTLYCANYKQYEKNKNRQGYYIVAYE